MSLSRAQVITIKAPAGMSEYMGYWMIDAIRHGYAEIPPQDRRDALVIMHPRMWDLIIGTWVPSDWRLSHGRPPETVNPLRELTERPKLDHIFGMPLEMSEDLDWTVVEMRAENAHDRALRRAQERGQQVNVMAWEPMHLPEVIHRPPTLKALLTHWARKARKVTKR